MDSAPRIHKVGRVVVFIALLLVVLFGLWWCGQAANNVFVKAVKYDFLFHWTMLIAGIALCGLVAASALLKMPAPENLATVTIATLFAAYVVEGALWMFNITPGDHFNRLERSGKAVDHRTPLQIVADARKGGRRDSLVFFPSLHVTPSRKAASRLFPLSSVALVPTVQWTLDRARLNERVRSDAKAENRFVVLLRQRSRRFGKGIA